MKNNNFKDFIIFIIIFQLLQEEAIENNIYNLINLSNINTMERLITEEKNKQIAKKLNKLKNQKRQLEFKINSELDKEKKKQDSKINSELDKEKKKQDSKINSELRNGNNNEILKEKHDLRKEKSNHLNKENIQSIKKKSSYIPKVKNKLEKEYKSIKKDMFCKVPIVIASFETEITEMIFTKIENTFIDIKEVKNNIIIEDANLIKLNSDKAKLFISGYIRSYIEYITLDAINKNTIMTKNQGLISYKDFSKSININLLFLNNMEEGEPFVVDFNNYINDKKILLGRIGKLDIKSINIYKDVKNFSFEREKCYSTLQQNLLIRAKIDILQNNVVIL